MAVGGHTTKLKDITKTIIKFITVINDHKIMIRIHIHTEMFYHYVKHDQW